MSTVQTQIRIDSGVKKQWRAGSTPGDRVVQSLQSDAGYALRIHIFIAVTVFL